MSLDSNGNSVGMYAPTPDEEAFLLPLMSSRVCAGLFRLPYKRRLASEPPALGSLIAFWDGFSYLGFLIYWLFTSNLPFLLSCPTSVSILIISPLQVGFSALAFSLLSFSIYAT